MLGQPVSMLIPKVVGFKLSGAIPTGVTATDVVLTITEMLRKHGVVGKFVEFYGEGVASVPLANRATIGNMSPEFGSTAAMFPIDDVTARLPAPHRPQRASRSRSSRRTPRSRRSGTTPSREPVFSEYLELDLVDGRPVDRRPEAPAGPHRPRRTPRRSSRATSPNYAEVDHDLVDLEGSESFPASDPPGQLARGRVQPPRAPPPQPRAGERRRSRPRSTLADGEKFTLDHGAVTIAAITSCTNTSNPSVMLAAGLLARNAVKKGLKAKPWVKTTLAPGLEGRHRLLREGRSHAGPRGPRLLHRRLRLHDLHRQLRARSSRRSRRRSTRTTSPSPRCSRATATSRAASTPT